MSQVVGPVAFLQLGIACPLEAIEHTRTEILRATGALTIKLVVSPIVLFAVGQTVGAKIPTAFYLLAAMPTAFHLLVLSRVYDVRPTLMRLLIVSSTVLVVVGCAVGSFFA
jgi:predicted permease